MPKDAETRFAKSDDYYIAYQVFGQGPDLVFVPGWFSHLEVMWEIPPLARFLERLGSFCRVTMIDKRGTGLSDPLPRDQAPSLEDRMDDVRAVLDAVGIDKAAFLGISEGGPMAMLFAATHPQRTTHLVLLATYARVSKAQDYEFASEPGASDQFLERIEARWGDGVGLGALAPSYAADKDMIAQWGRYQRMSCGPSAASTLIRQAANIDMRHSLAAVQSPTLIVHSVGDLFVSIEHGRYLARNIAGATLVELPGTDHAFFGEDANDILNATEEFLTGEVGTGPDQDRVLATVLFTDIVDSTARAAAEGDAAWRSLLDRHDAMVRRQLERFKGNWVKSTGDGVLATFDGPARAVRCAAAITQNASKMGLSARAGLHTGECELRGDDVAGIAVHIGARVAALANADEVLVSSTVRDLVAGSGLDFEERGTHQLKGVPNQWRIFQARA